MLDHNLLQKVRNRKRQTGKTRHLSSVSAHKIAIKKTTHGFSETRFYNIWSGINSRCNNKNSNIYKYYGGKGIKNKWVTFESFYKDMFNSYVEHSKIHTEKNTTLERINLNKNYLINNCKWVTRKEQSRNRTSNIYLTFKGQTKIIADWSKELNIPRSTIFNRIKAGKSINIILKQKTI